MATKIRIPPRMIKPSWALVGRKVPKNRSNAPEIAIAKDNIVARFSFSLQEITPNAPKVNNQSKLIVNSMMLS